MLFQVLSNKRGLTSSAGLASGVAALELNELLENAKPGSPILRPKTSYLRVSDLSLAGVLTPELVRDWLTSRVRGAGDVVEGVEAERLWDLLLACRRMEADLESCKYMLVRDKKI